MASVKLRKWTHNGKEKSAYVVRYKDGPAHRSKQFERKKDADDFKKRVEREQFEGTHVADTQTRTVKAACEEFLRYQEDRLSDGRIGRNRHTTLKVHVVRSIIPRLGTKLLTGVKPLDLERFYSDCTKLDGLHPRTARSRLQTYKLIEAFAMRRGMLKEGAAQRALQDTGGLKPPRIRTFTATQVQHLLAVAETRSAHKLRSSAMLRVAVNLAAFCGLRLGEIMGLTRDNADTRARVIRVRHSLPFWDELKGPKTEAGVRDVPMPVHVAALLDDWLKHHFVANEQDLIFRTARGGRIDNASFSEMWRGLLKRAGLHEGGQLRFHALRHFAASWMIHNGLALTDVAELMGHEKFDMTLQVYAHPVSGGYGHRQAVDAMAASLRALPPVLDYATLTHEPLSN